jgi:hypothetical protein
MDASLAEVLATTNIFEHAKAFINLRNKSFTQIEELVIEFLKLVKKHDELLYRAYALNPSSRFINEDAIKLNDQAGIISSQIYKLVD